MEPNYAKFIIGVFLTVLVCLLLLSLGIALVLFTFEMIKSWKKGKIKDFFN